MGGELTLRIQGFAEGTTSGSMNRKGLLNCLPLICAGNSLAAVEITKNPAPALKEFTISLAGMSHKMITNDIQTEDKHQHQTML